MANTEKIVVQVVVQGDKDLKKLEGRTKSTTKSFGKMTAGIVGAVAAFRTITAAVGSAIKTFRDFEFQMAKVKAITGANNVDFKKLSNTALELGRSTFFTAQQVAELQTNFGKLGFSTQEILDAQKATLQLATATDSDLARAAVVAGAAVRGFGLDAKETQRVTDVMASAFTSSALDLEKFQTSMTKVAPIAAGANISLEATTAVMGTLTDAGIEASIAGTSLRNIFLKMQDPASDLSKHLGFTVNSSDDLERALQQLNAEGLSNAQMMELVDLRQVAAFQTMIKGSERVLHLTKQFNLSNGAAEEMANTVGDTLEGAFKRMISATEGLQIALMKGGGGMARFINNIADFTNRITDSIAPQETQIELLQQTTQEMDDQFTLLTQGNLSQEARVQVIQDLNTKYGDYLPNLVSEKDDLEDIRDIQIEVNNLMMERIVAMAMEEELAELAKTQTKAIKGQVNSNITLAKIKKDNLSTDIAVIKSNENLKEQTEGIMLLNKVRIDNAEQDKKDLIAGYEETAKKLGLSFTSIMDNLNAARKAKEDADKEKKDDGGGGSITTFESEKERINKEARELQNIFKQGLVDKEIIQETFDQVAFDAEQQRLQDLLDLYTKYKEDTSIINKQILDSQLNMIAEKTKAEAAANAAEEKARKEQISDMDKVGQQLITLAGNDEKYQKIREVGIKISAAAALANNVESLSLQMKGLSASLAEGFPKNIIAVASTLALLMSIRSNMAALSGGKMARGGMIEEFANGGMVHGKSHAQGGEKFAVGGRVVELEGGEAVINKRSTSMFRNQLSAMNSAGGGVKFADGGLLNMPSFSQQQFNAVGQNQMMGAMGGASKVVVVEADITSTQNSVSVIEADAII